MLMHLKALRSLAEPGEGVGLLAAQVSPRRSSCKCYLLQFNVTTL